MTLVKVIRGLLGDSSQEPNRPEVNGVTVNTVTPAKVKRLDVKVVLPDDTPALEQRGWRKRDNTWHGHYVLKQVGTFEGRIEKRGDIYYPFIRRPPQQIKNSPKFSCLHPQEKGWWWIHLHENSTDDPGSIVLYIERLLHQALSNSEGRRNV